MSVSTNTVLHPVPLLKGSKQGGNEEKRNETITTQVVLGLGLLLLWAVAAERKEQQ